MFRHAVAKIGKSASPCWHRNQRKKRSCARKLIQKAKSCTSPSTSLKLRVVRAVNLLEAHHSVPYYRFLRMYKWNRQQWNAGAWSKEAKKAWDKSGKEKGKGQNFVSYDGSKLTFPTSSPSPSLPRASSSGSTPSDDALRLALLAQVVKDPKSIPDEIKQLMVSELNPRQMMQKQLNVVKKLEAKLKKKSDFLGSKKSRWADWKANLKALVLQETERYEKETAEIQKEIESLQVELEAEQEKLKTGNLVEMEGQHHLNMETDEEDLEHLLKDAPPSDFASGLPQNENPAKPITLGQPLTSSMNNGVDMKQHLHKMLQDPTWIAENQEVFMQIMATSKINMPYQMESNQHITGSPQVKSPGQKDPLKPFGKGKKERPGPYSSPISVRDDKEEKDSDQDLLRQMGVESADEGRPPGEGVDTLS